MYGGTIPVSIWLAIYKHLNLDMFLNRSEVSYTTAEVKWVEKHYYVMEVAFLFCFRMSLANKF